MDKSAKNSNSLSPILMEKVSTLPELWQGHGAHQCPGEEESVMK